MPDYRQQTGTSQSWRRARQVGISNERGVTPSISFNEEDVVTFDGREFRTPAMSAVNGSFDPAATIPLVDPDTGELTGQVATQGQLYVLVHSLYIQLAQKRDADILLAAQRAADQAAAYAAQVAAAEAAAAAAAALAAAAPPPAP